MINILPTEEDIDIRLNRKINGNAHSWIRTLAADGRDADIMRRLARTRRNNKHARAHAEYPGRGSL